MIHPTTITVTKIPLLSCSFLSLYSLENDSSDNDDNDDDNDNENQAEGEEEATPGRPDSGIGM